MDVRLLRRQSIIKKVISLIISLLIILIIFSLFGVVNKTNRVRIAGGDDCGTLPGADEIYPSVMYQGTIYYWKQMAGPVTKLPQGILPDGYEFGGSIEYTDSGEITEELQFTATFDASGKLFYKEEEPDRVCICLTTYWLDNCYVIFTTEKP